MRAAHNASTSGAMRIDTDDGEVVFDRLWAVNILW